MDRMRAQGVVWIATVLAVLVGVGSGVYWGWAHGKRFGVGGEPPAMWPAYVGFGVSAVLVLVAVAVGLWLFLTPTRGGVNASM